MQADRMILQVPFNEMGTHKTFPVLLVMSLHLMPCLSFISFLFGDSLVDAGNNNYLLTLSKADSPPYGIDFRASGGLPTGRFTNGRTVSDIIGQELGAKSFPPPYLAPNTQVATIFRGINYASGSSGILNETGLLFIGRVSLWEQINYFEQSRNYMVKEMGENGTRKFLKNAIFSLTIGSNDILNYVQPGIPFFGDPKGSPAVLQDSMISNLTLQLKRLHKLGARKFVVFGVGPLGCIPIVRALNLVPSGQCSVEINQLIQGYNKKLNETLKTLSQEMGPESVFVYVNSYDVFLGIIINYHQYGFENANEPCCGGYFPPFICFKGPNAHVSSVLCEDRSKYVFWDAYHPTEAANIFIAKRFLDDDNISFPINLRKLYTQNS